MTSLVRPTLAATLAAAVLALPGAAMAAQPNELVIVFGAIKDRSDAQYAKAPVDKSVPELPVVYDTKKTDDPSAHKS